MSRVQAAEADAVTPEAEAEVHPAVAEVHPAVAEATASDPWTDIV